MTGADPFVAQLVEDHAPTPGGARQSQCGPTCERKPAVYHHRDIEKYFDMANIWSVRGEVDGDKVEKTFDIGVNEAERMRNRMNGLGVVNDLHGVFDALRPAGDVHPGGPPDAVRSARFRVLRGLRGSPPLHGDRP